MTQLGDDVGPLGDGPGRPEALGQRLGTEAEGPRGKADLGIGGADHDAVLNADLLHPLPADQGVVALGREDGHAVEVDAQAQLGAEEA